MSWRNYTGPTTPAYGSGAAAAVTTVTDVMDSLKGQVTLFTNKSMEVLDELSTLSIPDVGAVPPVTIPTRVEATAWAPPTGLALGDLGDLTVELPEAPAMPSLDTTFEVAIPIWEPSVVAINVPAAPAGIDTSGVPVRPDVDTSVDMPSRPTLIMPVMEALDTLTIPTYIAPNMPLFNDDAPVFDATAPSAVINWAEPAYSSESLAEVQATINRMMAGGTGLSPEIEQQLFDRARSREDLVASKAVAEAFDTFANKGFTMPPGALVAQVNAAREQNQLQANALQREVMTKVADIEVENLRFAVGQGVAIETLLSNIFNNAAQRTFEMARFTVQSQIDLYNAKVSVFNTLMSAYSTKAQVFKVKVDAALATLDAYRAQLEGQKVLGEINQQKVATFNARVQALTSQVEIYKADMQGAQVKAEVIRSQLDAYRVDVQAYAERVGADKLRFDAYRAQVDGEVAKVGIVEAEARVFGARVQAAAVETDIKFKGVQASLEKMSNDTQRYVAQLDSAKTELQSKLSKVEAAARVAGLNIQFMSVQTDAERAKHEADVRISEVQLQSNISITQASIQRFKVGMDKILQEADMKARSLQAAGQIASTLAGGAMAAQHVQASISSSSQDSSNVSVGFSQSASENWQYEATS